MLEVTKSRYPKTGGTPRTKQKTAIITKLARLNIATTNRRESGEDFITDNICPPDIHGPVGIAIDTTT